MCYCSKKILKIQRRFRFDHDFGLLWFGLCRSTANMNYGGMIGYGPGTSLNRHELSYSVRLNPTEKGDIALMFGDGACCV